ncbi:MAG: class I SAM-dependent methyltransferase [Candidatus Eisenbacteria bacterium]
MTVTQDPRAVVREAYERASRAYRGDDFDYAGSGYAYWLDRFMVGLRPGARVLDAGCGNGLPAARELARRCAVTGIDLSPVNVERARKLVPGARFMCADMTTVAIEPGSFDAIVAFYSLIHVPIQEQAALVQRFADWLVPGGQLLATVGQEAWTGIETDWRGVEGVQMYYSHAHVRQYRIWFQQAGLVVKEQGRIPLHGNPGYAMLAAAKPSLGG